MRTKDEIIRNIFDDLKTARSLGHIEKAIDLPLLEVLIDIRDILNGLKGFIKEHLINTDKGY